MLIVFIVAAYPIAIVQRAIIRLALVINKVDVDTIGHAIREVSPFGREVISGHLSLMTKNIYRRIVIYITDALDELKIIRCEIRINDDERIGEVGLNPLQDKSFVLSIFTDSDIAVCIR